MLIIGDGGHAKVIREVLTAMGAYFGDSYAFIAVGENGSRKREAERHAAYTFPVLIHPSAVVSPSARIGAGTVIMAGVVVQANVIVGEHCILNTGCSVDHETSLENFVHIAPGAHLCGGVYVGEGALVGVGVGVAPMGVVPAWTLCKARRLEFEAL